MTKREFFVAITNAEVAQELKDFATEQIVALDGKNVARNSKAKAKKAEENAPLVKALSEILADGQVHWSSDICTALGTNSSKVAVLVKALGNLKVDKAKKEGAKAKTTTYQIVAE